MIVLSKRNQGIKDKQHRYEDVLNLGLSVCGGVA